MPQFDEAMVRDLICRYMGLAARLEIEVILHVGFCVARTCDLLVIPVKQSPKEAKEVSIWGRWRYLGVKKC